MTGDAKPRGVARLLLVAGERWHDTSRIALAARDAGFEVYLLGPEGHPVASLPWVNCVNAYSTLRPVASVKRALQQTAFDVVLPVDDVAAAGLFESYASGRLSVGGAALIRRSLGDPESFGVRHRRVALAEIAAEAGLPAPRTWSVPSEDALPGIVESAGLPAMLKSDGSFAGREVVMVESLGVARAAYDEMSSLPRLKSSLGSWLFDRDANLLRRRLRRARRQVSVQEFVEGDPATISAVAWEGELQGHIALRVVRARYANGPAVVIEPLEHPDMTRAAEVVARRLGLSGFFGLDFILSPDMSKASLLELNPRVTPTSHLHLPSLQRPLFHLLGDCIGAETIVSRLPLPVGRIAMFPHSTEDPGGDADAYLDIPDSEEVVALCIAEGAVSYVKPLSRATDPVVQALRRLF